MTVPAEEVPSALVEAVRDRLAGDPGELTPHRVALALREAGRPVGDATVLAVHEALRRDAAQRAPARRTEGFASLAATLTHRERDVLDLVLKGLSSKVIARELAISHRTVEQHRGRLLEKFNVGSVTELVRLAFDRGSQ